MYLTDFFKNAPEIEINQLSCDSRVPMKDCIFFCIKGIKYNGHLFIDEAINNGANVIVYSDEIDINKNAIFVKVSNVDDVLTQVSSKFYNYPAKSLESYIVAGTNGRSTVSKIITHILEKEKKCSSIGVFGIYDGDDTLLSTQPTLPILETQANLKRFVDNDCKAVVLEATAMSLSYKKLDMIKPNAFIYTCTNDYDADYKEFGLDYYDSLKRYLYTLDNSSLVVLNRDDSTYDKLSKAAGDNMVTYGQNDQSDYQILDINIKADSTSFVIKHNDSRHIIHSVLLSEVNVYNLTAALAALNANGYDMDYLVETIGDLEYTDGVVDRLNFDDFNIYIDCASTLSSYEKIINFGYDITKLNKRVITIISVNDRDTESKLEALMKIADLHSDLLILTTDDAYEDDAFDNMQIAAKYITKHHYLIIDDREEAIEEAIELLNKGDCLLILGKGNEDYMYQGLVRKSYIGDKNNAYKYMNKRLKEEVLVVDSE